HGRRARARACLQIPHRTRRSQDADLIPRGDGWSRSRVAWCAVAAEADRPGGGARHAAYRTRHRRAAREAHGPRRPSRTGTHSRKHGAHGDAGGETTTAAPAPAEGDAVAETLACLAGAYAGGEEGPARA